MLYVDISYVVARLTSLYLDISRSMWFVPHSAGRSILLVYITIKTYIVITSYIDKPYILVITNNTKYKSNNIKDILLSLY